MNPTALLVLAAFVLVICYRRRILDDLKQLRSEPRVWLRDKWEDWIKPLLIAAVLAMAIRTFLLGPYKIPTGSMRETLMEGDRIFVDKVTYRFREPKRGEIIVFKYPLDRKKDFVKRLVAFGEEEVEIRDGGLWIGGKRIEDPRVIADRFYYNREDWEFGKEGQGVQVPKGHYFVLGDNSAHSSDSRNWGFVPARDVVGRAVVIWWPLQRIRLLKNS